ncbi:MAG: rod shape-determining protein RodA [Candidatus Moraniibacteriota bacterium]|nr:MAG: rod shape-determining protein RodA [Candidatus Moranbacteria bacterium]
MIQKFFSFDFITFFTIVLLLGFGIVAIGSIFLYGDGGNEVFTRHVTYTVVGVIAFLFFSLMNYTIFRSYSTYLYFFSIALLIVTLFFGTTLRGTSGWLDLGLVSFQPVEIVKIFMIIFLAHFISEKRGELGELASIFISFILVSIVSFLILLQPDFGSAIVLYGIWFCMIFVSGIRKRYLLSFIIVGVVVSVIAWSLFAPYQRARIINFLHPELDPQGTGYNVLQSIIAVGNGGMFGQGFGHGSQSQLDFLPEKHTDFIFATIAESTGFFGSLILLVLFSILFSRFYFIASQSRDAFGYFLSVGVMAFFLIHVLINVGMNIGVMPVTGIPLPLVSYGGSSLVSFLIGCGLVMSVYLRREVTMKNYIESY